MGVEKEKRKSVCAKNLWQDTLGWIHELSSIKKKVGR